MCKVTKLRKEKVVWLWAIRGVAEFYIGFDIWDRFDWYSAFFWHQGLEKLCKAYLLGLKENVSRYECLSVQRARAEIDKVVRKEMGHNLSDLLEKLTSTKVLDENIMTKSFARLKNQFKDKNITGKDCVEVLEKAYTECRYPLVPNPASRIYLSPNKTISYNIMSSQDLMKFAFEVGLRILKRIEQDYNFTIPRDNTLETEDGHSDKFLTFAKDEDWLRFRRVFLKRITILENQSISDILNVSRNLL